MKNLRLFVSNVGGSPLPSNFNYWNILKWRYLILMSMCAYNLTCLSQNANNGFTSITLPNGIISDFKLFDRFGNEHSLSQVSIYPEQMENVIESKYTEGLFTLYFEDVIQANNLGFNDPNLGLQRQSIVRQVFRNLSNLLLNNGTSNDGKANILIQSNFSIAASANNPSAISTETLTAGSSLYLVPKGADNLLLCGEVQKTIGTGKNSYSQLPEVYFERNPSVMFQGLLVVNLEQNWHLDVSSLPNNNSYDFYTLVLKEALHILGLASNISNNGSPKPGHGCYFYYDKFLKMGNEPILENENGFYHFSPHLSSLSCDNGIVFSGDNLQSIPIYCPDTSIESWNNAENLSNLGCVNDKPITNVLSAKNLGGADFTLRHPSEVEVSMLQQIGYIIDIDSIIGDSIKTIFGNDAQADLGVYQEYTIKMPQSCDIIGVNDWRVYQNQMGNLAVYPLVNDINSTPTSTFASLKLLTNNGIQPSPTDALSYTQNTNKSFIIQGTNWNFTGCAIFAYIPVFKWTNSTNYFYFCICS